jgi:hypothetical protein
MSCTHEAIKQLFTKAGIPRPRSAKFERILQILFNNQFPYPNQNRTLTAETQAKLLCIVLQELEDRAFAFSQSLFRRHTQFAFVFVHPTKGNVKGEHSFGHCLALHRRFDCISRYCAVEDNWRTVKNEHYEFQFNDRDWTTSVPHYFVEKPFEFSFFITASGYTTWVKPRTVLEVMEKEVEFDHDHKYNLKWENI